MINSSPASNWTSRGERLDNSIIKLKKKKKSKYYCLEFWVWWNQLINTYTHNLLSPYAATQSIQSETEERGFYIKSPVLLPGPKTVPRGFPAREEHVDRTSGINDTFSVQISVLHKQPQTSAMTYCSCAPVTLGTSEGRESPLCSMEVLRFNKHRHLHI